MRSMSQLIRSERSIRQSLLLFRLSLASLSFAVAALAADPVHASLFKGEALDTAANVLSWVVLVIVPVIGLTLFWLVHILPEKIAEKKKHPQAQAIQTLCLLSLVFGGLLWPLAWLWAYTKPVLYKMAYGTDTVEHGHGKQPEATPQPGENDEVKQLRQRVVELEKALAEKTVQQGEKA